MTFLVAAPDASRKETRMSHPLITRLVVYVLMVVAVAVTFALIDPGPVEILAVVALAGLASAAVDVALRRHS